MGKQLKIGLFLAGTGHHVASWRHPKALENGAMNLSYLKGIAQKAEEGKLDMIFLADSLSVNENSHPNVISRFEPFTLLAVLAEETEKIGLAATGSTTYSEPFHLARQFSSLDHLSNGRAGWNVVTSSIAAAALNFSKQDHMDHALRYERAEEFVEVVKELWDSWEDETLIRDKETGQFIDPQKLHKINHKGRFFEVKGPLNIERSPQGHPVIIQAGSSNDGRNLAARTSEVIFTAQDNLEDAKLFYADVKRRVREFGRDENQALIMPGIFPVLGETEEEAQQLYDELQELIPKEVGLSVLSSYLGGINLNDYPLDAKFTELQFPETDSVKSRYELIMKMAQEGQLTLEQVYKRIAGSRGHHLFIGTPEQLADKMAQWLDVGGCDGFNLMPPLLPDGLDLFVDRVIPLLQERGLFRKEYESTTLRGHLGLDFPANQFSEMKE
ncbi:LLM class flavin-dependent oxidoreductase [Planococcus sp. 1R117A]|uniref:LLM class flavin-dependent oxidoreductase n=1 Tax=Planococcus sp. 1R117A TaxID=3447020 RepID=UPI003EDC0CBD